ncbi:phage holin family protein [Aeromicrobium sp. CF3.5]|uniref:phage holin family protein n=1 Tax=Aeromicrobium sp. CF3.5 TaxID=3373078 RepID=UPI003EE5BB36
MSTPHKTDAAPTIGALAKDVERNLSDLVRSEIALAKSEVKFSVKAGGIGAGLLAVVAFLGLLLIIMLSITAAYFIVMAGLHPAWAFLIVSGFYLLLIVVLGLVGIRLLKKVKAPTQTISTAKAIPPALKGHKDSAAPASPPLR